MALPDGWSINSTLEDQEEEETPLLRRQAEQLTGWVLVMVVCGIIRNYNLGLDFILV